MGLADLFRPKWKHSNPDVRAEAVRQLGDDQLPLLASIVQHDADAHVRRVALKRVDDTEVLAGVAARDPDEGLRKAAAEKAEELLLARANSADEKEALAALTKLGQPRLWAQIACKSALPSVRARAVELIGSDEKALGDVARRASEATLRKLAVSRLHDTQALRDVAIGDRNKEVALAAVERLDDAESLDKIVNKAQSKAVRQAAREKLPPPEKKAETPEAQKRVRLLGLIREAELATDAAEIEAVRVRFVAEGAEIELRRRFDRTCERFYAKRVQATRVKQVAKAVEPRLAELTAAPVAAVVTEPTAAAPAPVVDGRIRAGGPSAIADGRIRAGGPSAIADEEAERREAERKAEREAAFQRRADETKKRDEEAKRRETERAEARARREIDEKANLARLEHLATELDALVIEDLKRGGDALKRAQQAFDALVPLGRDALPAKERWQAARDKQRARMSELREAEEWKRWSLVPKLEALCVRAEKLLEATDAKLMAAELKVLQAEWKAVGPTNKEKQEQLWTRFKAAADQLHERNRAFFATLDEQSAGNLAKKEELAARVEALVDSPDLKETSELIKALQEEWKAVGHVPKDKGDAVWKRFRGACDKFFARRKEQFEAGDVARLANLQKQEELIAAVEKLATSTDWKRTGDEIKQLQADWKAVGPVPRDKSEATWKRFRAGCDTFFAARQVHWAKLDEERAENLKAKQLLCEKVEALGDAPDVDEAMAIVRTLQTEWKAIGPAPKEQADDIWNRFRAAGDKIFDRARKPEAAPAAATSSGAAAAPEAPIQGYSAPKLGDKLAELLKK
jgi:hypothetical protein